MFAKVVKVIKYNSYIDTMQSKESRTGTVLRLFSSKYEHRLSDPTVHHP